MIEVVPLAPENELPVANRLRDVVAEAWPDVVDSGRDDRIRILVGLRMKFEVDLLVEIALSRPRLVPARKRRDGTASRPASVSSALIAVEVKQLDASRFVQQGPLIFARYGRDCEKRSVNQQIVDAVRAVRKFRERYTSVNFYVHGIGWLTEVPDAQLAGVEPIVAGRDADWFGLLDAAAQQNAVLYRTQPEGYRRAIATVCEVLVRSRNFGPIERERVDELTTSAVTHDVLTQARPLLGKRQIRLAGGAGTGKSTALALLACEIAKVKQERVLLLTYNVALRDQLARLVRSIIGNDRVFESKIRVESILDFLARACSELGCGLPRKSNGELDYSLFESALTGFVRDRAACARLREDAAVLKEIDSAGFAFDYVFIDECQDCTDGERDVLRVLYPQTAFVLADGLDQLIRRAAPCDWRDGVPRDVHAVIELRHNLRVAPNIAAFVAAFARAAGLEAWRVEPHPELAGGRIVMMYGRIGPAFVQTLEELRSAARASPVDVLVCAASGLEHPGRRARDIAGLFKAAGRDVWEGYDPVVRRAVSPQTDTVRIIYYDSARGLEGWVTALVGLDEFYRQRLRYPNLPAGEDRPTAEVARGWLLMALMRASHTLVVHVDDRESQVARWLRAASAALPRGIVEDVVTPAV